MNIKKHLTTIWALIAALWIIVTILGTTGHFIIGLCLCVPLMFLHMLLGSARGGVVSRKFIIYPLMVWAVLWLLSFILSGYFAARYRGVMPAFTFLGFHPSFAPTVFLYWIGGQLTLNLGYFLHKDEWLSEDEWENFLKKMKSIKEDDKK